jgi:hypothetical protein
MDAAVLLSALQAELGPSVAFAEPPYFADRTELAVTIPA